MTVIVALGSPLPCVQACKYVSGEQIFALIEQEEAGKAVEQLRTTLQVRRPSLPPGLSVHVCAGDLCAGAGCAAQRHVDETV